MAHPVIHFQMIATDPEAASIVKLKDIAEAADMFAGFTPIAL